MNKTITIATIVLAMSPVLANSQNDQNTKQQPTITMANIAPDKTDATQRYIVMFNSRSENNYEKSTDNVSVFNRDGFSSDQANRLITSFGGQTIRTLPSITGLSAELTEQQHDLLKNNPQISLIEPDPRRTFQAEVKPYGIEKIQAHLLSDANTANIKICIPDTGIALGHEDLPGSSNITGEVSNTLTEPMDIGEWSQDTYGHGTHMAGTIAAIGSNNLGVVGVNPGGNIKLHMVKVIDNPGWWPFRGSDLIAAVERCQAAGANIINMSIAGDNSSIAEQQAMQAAYDAGTLLVGASGRGGNAEHKYPASYDSVISAAAIDAQEAPWQYSHFNDQIELSAPGVEIKSTTPNNNYADWDGTSVAAAYISGAAGLVWSFHPECSNKEIRNILQQTSKDLAGIGRDDNTGYGLIQAKAAVDLIDQRGCSGNGEFNHRPTITGSPGNSVNEAELYQFIPAFADADSGDTLTLSISNKPGWANFDLQTGELSGTPADGDAGIYNDISISVTDSKGASASTLLFSIEVVNVDFPQLPTSNLQTLSLVGNDIVLTNPDGSIMSVASINDADSDPGNEIQTISQVGSTVTLSHGGGTFIAEKGDKGEKGDIGLKGDTGDKGDVGEKGGEGLLKSNPTAVTVRNTLDESELASVTIPANTLGTGNVVEFILDISHMTVGWSDSGQKYSILRLKLGNSTLATHRIPLSDNRSYRGDIKVKIYANEATNAQIVVTKIGLNGVNMRNGIVESTPIETINRASMSHDSTNPLNLKVTVQSEYSLSATMSTMGYTLTVLRRL